MLVALYEIARMVDSADYFVLYEYLHSVHPRYNLALNATQ